MGRLRSLTPLVRGAGYTLTFFGGGKSTQHYIKNRQEMNVGVNGGDASSFQTLHGL